MQDDLRGSGGMRVLITGSQGFIGTYLCRALQEKNIDFLGCDLGLGGQGDYMQADVIRSEEIGLAFENFRPTHVFHLAGEVGRYHGEEFPHRCVSTNLTGTLNVIRNCLKYKSILYFASSSEIYGDASWPLGEFTKRGEILNVYGLSKWQAEEWIGHYIRRCGLKAVILRFFNIYGPGEVPNYYRSAMANFIYRTLTGKRIEVHEGTARSWCYIDDLIKCLFLLLNHKVRRGDWGKQIYNIGCNELAYMVQLARTIAKLSGRITPIKVVKRGPLDVKVKNPSFASVEKTIGWKASTSLAEGVEKTIEWQKDTFGIGGNAKL